MILFLAFYRGRCTSGVETNIKIKKISTTLRRTTKGITSTTNPSIQKKTHEDSKVKKILENAHLKPIRSKVGDLDINNIKIKNI